MRTRVSSSYRSVQVGVPEEKEFEGVVIWFSQGRPQGKVDQLWWTRATTPDEVREVVAYAARRRLPVEAVVIDGLGEYPMGEAARLSWLVSLVFATGPRVVVDTRGMGGEEVRRLRAKLSRALKSRDFRDPGGFWRDWIGELFGEWNESRGDKEPDRR